MTSTGEQLPAAVAEEELTLSQDKDVQANPTSSQLKTPKETKEQEKPKECGEKKKQEAVQSLKSSIILSGLVVAVVGAIFAITKKLREK